MKARQYGLLIAIASAAFLPAKAENALDACGTIKYVSGTSKQDTATVRHLGVRSPARRTMLLFDGDIVEVSGNASICTMIEGDEICLDSRKPKLTVMGHGLGAHSENDDGFFTSLEILFDTPLKPITYFVHVRDGSKPIVYDIKADSLAPAGAQVLPEGVAKLALLWTGGPSKLEVTVDNSATEVPVGSYSSAVIDVPAHGSFRVETSDPSVSWDISRDDAIPKPDWFAASAPLSDAQRIVRASWILKSNDHPQWRLFALTELAALSDAKDFAAIQLWTAARSGQLAGFLKANAKP